MHPQFVICSERRTGSHMLATALNDHSELRVAGEAFFRPRQFGLGLPAARRNDIESARAIYSVARQRFNGLILHRSAKGPLQVIGEHPGVLVLFLRREDWLAQLASDCVARRTGIWHVGAPGKDYLSNDGQTQPVDNPPVIQIPKRRCLRFRQRLAEDEAAAAAVFSRHKVHDVTLESLQSDWDATMRGILNFLQVPFESLAPATEKQERRELREVVENYDELRRLFG